MPAQPSRTGSRKRIGLMLVDDHPMWRDTLKRILQSRVGTVVAEASDGEEALSLADKMNPELVVMDINLPSMNGIEATRRLVSAHPETKVLILASSDERTQVMDAVKSGASGYLLKTAGPDEVVDAVTRIHQGQLVFPPSIATMVLSELRNEGVPSAPVRVMLADDEILAREGLARLLKEAGFEVVGGAGTAEDLVAGVESHSPDVAIIDAGMGIADQVRSQFPSLAVLVLSAAPVAAQAVSLLSPANGGIGYLLKSRISNIEELTDAVHRVAAGEPVVDPQVVSGLVERPAQSEALDQLTEREREVLALMAEGHSNQAIAERLFLGAKTVETHVSRVFAKLGLEPAGDIHRRVLAVIAYLRST